MRSLLFIAGVVFCGWLVARVFRVAPRLAPGKRVLEYGLAYKALAVVGFFMAALEIGFFGKILDQGDWVSVTGAALLVVVGLGFAPEAFRRRISFDENGLFVRSPWRASRSIPWADLTRVTYSRLGRVYRIETRFSGAVRLPEELSGRMSLLDECKGHGVVVAEPPPRNLQSRTSKWLYFGSLAALLLFTARLAWLDRKENLDLVRSVALDRVTAVRISMEKRSDGRSISMEPACWCVFVTHLRRLRLTEDNGQRGPWTLLRAIEVEQSGKPVLRLLLETKPSLAGGVRASIEGRSHFFDATELWAWLHAMPQVQAQGDPQPQVRQR